MIIIKYVQCRSLFRAFSSRQRKHSLLISTFERITNDTEKFWSYRVVFLFFRDGGQSVLFFLFSLFLFFSFCFVFFFTAARPHEKKGTMRNVRERTSLLRKDRWIAAILIESIVVNDRRRRIMIFSLDRPVDNLSFPVSLCRRSSYISFPFS